MLKSYVCSTSNAPRVATTPLCLCDGIFSLQCVALNHQLRSRKEYFFRAKFLIFKICLSVHEYDNWSFLTLFCNLSFDYLSTGLFLADDLEFNLRSSISLIITPDKGVEVKVFFPHKSEEFKKRVLHVSADSYCLFDSFLL